MAVTNIRGQQILNGTVQYVDIQQVSASRLVGNPTTSVDTMSEISLGTGLSFSSGALVLSANLQSLSGLTYSSASFVKMTAAGTFALDTNTYITGSGSTNVLPKWTSSSSLGNSLLDDDGTSASVALAAGGKFNIKYLSAIKLGLTGGTTFGSVDIAAGLDFLIRPDSIEKFKLSSTGLLKLANYGAGSVTGTATYRLAVDSVGNVIEVSDGGGTVTSVSGTGTVSGLTLTGTVTSSGSLTLGGTLTLTSGQVTTALGYTPYNATNPNGYISSYTETDTLASVTGRGFVTRASSGAFAINTQGTPGLEIIGAGSSDPAYITFHRPSQYAIRFGLDGTDLKVGGWNAGNVAYKLWHEGNLTNLNQLTNGPGYITGYTETDTLQSVTNRGASSSNTITLSSTAPLTFTGFGGGTYTQSVIYVDTNGFTIEGPLATDAAGGTQKDIIFTWRGGYGAKGGMKLTSTGAFLTGNVGINATSFTDVSFGSSILKVGGERATLALSSSGTLSTIALIAANDTSKAIHINQESTGALRVYQYSAGAETFVLGSTGAATFSSTVTALGTTVQIRDASTNNGARVLFLGSSTAKNFLVGNQWTVSDTFEITPSTTNGGTTFTTPAFSIAGSGAAFFSGNVSIGTAYNGFALNVNGTAYVIGGEIFLSVGQKVRNTSDTSSIAFNENALSFIGAATFNSTVTASSLIKSGGTSAQFLMADGSVSTNPGWITSSSLGAYLPLAGGTMTGDINWATTNRGLTWGMNTDGAYIKFFNTGDGDTDSRLEYGTSDNNNEYHRFLISGNERFTIKDDAARFNNNVVWHAGNDGSGSGLDADLLDGINSSGFIRTYGTTNNNIDSDYGECFITFDPIPSGTPPIQSPNLRTINVGSNFNRRTQLAFDYATDRGFFRRKYDSTWSSWVEFIHTGNISNYGYLTGNQTITLTGDVTGSGTTSIATTVNAYFDQRVYGRSDNYLGGYYSSGGNEKPNNSLFGGGKFKVAMLSGSNLGFGGPWNDVMWLSTYAYGDVKNSHALVFDKYSTDVWVADQDFDSATWGTGYKLWHSGNDGSGSGLDADLLDGYGPNQTGGANTIVQRDGNGYIQNSYFYMSGGGSERNSSGLGYVAGFNSSDYYVRSYNSTAVASFLGLGSMAYASTGSYLPLAGGTMSGKILTLSTGTGTYDTAIEIRETAYATTSQSAWGYSPAMTFHWGGRYAKRFGMRADGLFAVDDEPLALRSWVQTYAPTVTGGNASGTWGINISGSARLLDVDSDVVYGRSGLQFAQSYGPAGNTPSAHQTPTGDSWWHVLRMNHGNNSGYYADLAVSMTSNLGLSRRVISNGAQLSNWVTILDGLNYNSYSPTLTGGGASGTWGINITGNAATATNADTVDGYHEYAFLRYYGYSTSGNFQTFQSVAGRVRFDQVGDIGSGSWSNAPTGIYTYGGVLSFRGDSFGGQIYISHTGGMMYKGQWNDDQYSGWQRVLDTQNYNSYAPTLTGGNASGTWSINITGNAQYLANNYIGGADANNIWRAGSYTFFNGGNVPAGDFGLISFPTWSSTDSNSRYNLQLGSQIGGPLRYRSTNINGAGSWATMLSDANYNSYSPTLTGGGASGTWGISITGNAATASQVTINYGNDSNSTYYLLWGSGNSIYATGLVYVNPYTDTIYAYGYRGSGNVGGTGEASWHPAGIYSGSTQWLYGTTYRNSAATYGQGNLYFDGNYGYGMVGLYSDTRYQAVFAMGDSYKLPADGTTTGSLYGLAWSHPNKGGVAANLNTHGLLVMENGTFLAAISGSIRARDDMRAPIFYDSGNTNYYLDGNNNNAWRIGTPSGYLDIGPMNSSYCHFQTDRGNFYFNARIDVNGEIWRYGGQRFVENTGTWGISITGDAGSVDGIDSSRIVYGDGSRGKSVDKTGGNANTSDSSNPSGFYFGNTVTGMPNTEWYTWLNVAANSWSGGDGYGFQLANVFWSDDLKFRRLQSGTWYSWINIVTSGNIGTYAITSLSGETLQQVMNRGASSSTYMTLTGGGTFNSGQYYFKSNRGASVYLKDSNSAQLQAFSDDSSAAFMSFHRGGYYAVNMGLDPDNVFRIGGWSAGANVLQLDMSGNLYTAGNMYPGGHVYFANASSPYTNTIRFGDNTGWVFRFQTSVSGTYTTRFSFTDGGTFTAVGDVIAYSDARVKTNVATITDPLDKVTRMRGVTYNRTDGTDASEKVGVIAQEIQEVLPQVVTEDKDGMLGVSYGNLAGVFIEAFKEQQRQIEDLKKQIEYLADNK